MSFLVEDLRPRRSPRGQRFTLVGHDWGGLIGWAFAIFYPERLLRLIINTATHPELLDRAMKVDAEQQSARRFTLLLA